MWYILYLKKDNGEIMKHIIFDLDGTLWDATYVTTEAWKRVLLNHPETSFRGTIDHDTVCRYMGMTGDEVVTMIFGDSADGMTLMNECYDVENELLRQYGGILYDNVWETLIGLRDRGYHLYIVSNCQDGYIESFFAAHGLADLFDDYESFGRTGQEKADNIRLLMKRNQIKDAVYVGDTSGDGRAAAEAGIVFLYAKYGFGEKFGRGKCDTYDAAITNFSELVSVIKQF